MDSNLNDDDLLLLNAMVDGELAPDERAALAARLAVERELAHAYATLARLKATTSDIANQAAPAILVPPAKHRIKPRFAFTAAAIGIAAVLALAAIITTEIPRGAEQPAASVEGPTAITLASLPAGTTVPRLDTAGLKLIELAFQPGGVPVFTASYRGPHGCRLDLRAWRAGAQAPALVGTDRYKWSTGDLVYELVAHGMPRSRFAIIASAAELQTKAGSDHERIDQRLREANRAPPPCVG